MSLPQQNTALYQHSLIGQLGIEFLFSEKGHTPEKRQARMPVDERTMHPFGMLSGGASLALAESLAGQASLTLCTEHEFPCGVEVTAQHLASASKGDQVLATATLLQQTDRKHRWRIDIVRADGTLISTVQVVNKIILKKGL